MPNFLLLLKKTYYFSVESPQKLSKEVAYFESIH